MMSKNQKKLYLTTDIINSKYSLEEYLKDKLSELEPSYKQKIPKSHMIVFIDHFIRIARKTSMEDQKAYLDKLKMIKKRYQE